jgi:hypothetical protein|tara:strand:+ start:2122 stop:2832 length:711 start_codon:yes stop_codon:yes gene_type:complete
MVNLNELRKKYEQINKTGMGNADFLEKFLMMDEGTTNVRILPWKDDEKNFYAETAIHRIDDTNYHCPRVKGEPCPMCDLNHRLWKTKDDGNIEIARSIKARQRFYMNVVDRRDNKVKILSCGVKLYSKILDAFFDDDYGDLTETKDGWDFKIVKEKTGPWPSFDKSAPRPKNTPAGTDAEIAQWMEELHDIHGLIKIAEYETLKNLANSITSAGDGQTTNQKTTEDEDYLSHLKNL